MSNKCLQIGEMLRGLFTVANSSTPAEWQKDHPLFCLLVGQWIDEFKILESQFERLPDAWADMAEKESELAMAAIPATIDPEYSILTKDGVEKHNHPADKLATLKTHSDHEQVLRAGRWWLPLWQKLFPAIRGHQGKAPTDGPLGDRGWRHKGVEVSGLHGGEAMEAMRELFDKPFGHVIRPDSDLKKLADRINGNCKKIGLQWRAYKDQKAGTLTKIKPKPERGTKKGA